MESIIKCRIFWSGNANALEGWINEFAEELANHESKIVDIKYQATHLPETGCVEYTALVLYEVKESEK